MGGESVRDAMSRKIKETISTLSSRHGRDNHNTSSQDGSDGGATVGELLSVWHRPNFDPLILPYLPLHCSRPKERIEVYQVVLPERCTFMQKDPALLDIFPLHDLLLQSMSVDCPIINSIPSLLSKFRICRMEKE